MHVRRLPVIASSVAWAFVALAPPLSLKAAAALDVESALNLAIVMQLRAAVVDADQVLTAGLLDAPPTEGIPAEAGDAARARARALLLQYQPKERGAAAAETALKARLIRQSTAFEFSQHTKEAAERLSAIVESGYIDGLRYDALGKRVPLIRPEELLFLHRTLCAARDELDAAVRCFGDCEERREAVRFSGVAYAAGVQSPSSPGAPAPGWPASLSPRDTDDLISQAILKLPSRTGTALFRGDLQRTLDPALNAEDLRRITETYTGR